MMTLEGVFKFFPGEAKTCHDQFLKGLSKTDQEALITHAQHQAGDPVSQFFRAVILHQQNAVTDFIKSPHAPQVQEPMCSPFGDFISVVIEECGLEKLYFPYILANLMHDNGKILRGLKAQINGMCSNKTGDLKASLSRDLGDFDPSAEIERQKSIWSYWQDFLGVNNSVNPEYFKEVILEGEKLLSLRVFLQDRPEDLKQLDYLIQQGKKRSAFQGVNALAVKKEVAEFVIREKEIFDWGLTQKQALENSALFKNEDGSSMIPDSPKACASLNTLSIPDAALVLMGDIKKLRLEGLKKVEKQFRDPIIQVTENCESISRQKSLFDSFQKILRDYGSVREGNPDSGGKS